MNKIMILFYFIYMFVDWNISPDDVIYHFITTGKVEEKDLM